VAADPIVELFGLDAGVGLVTADLFGEGAEFRGEDDVRRFLGKWFQRRIIWAGRDNGGIGREANAVLGELVRDFEFGGLAFASGLFEVNRADRAAGGSVSFGRRRGIKQVEIGFEG